MKFKTIFLLPILFTACLNADPEEPHPCESAQHCVYDRAAGESNCEEGYTWANPSDNSNYNCVAIEGPSCTPTTCTEQNANCGTLPDGCDGTLACGECPVGQTCGAAGPNLCGEGECTPTTCVQAGAECGSISDGCGNLLDCGGCPSGETCGAITANQCGIICVPTTCDEQNAECGSISDGCSGTLDCGACSAGETCGAQAPNQCGEGACVPTTCAAEGAQCGSIPDGCSGTLDCGECGPGQVCGSQTANICTDIPCTPTTCAAQSATCGTISDGCGSTLNCGSCNGTDVCIQNTCAGTDSDNDGVSLVGDGTNLKERGLSVFADELTNIKLVDLDGDGKTDILGTSENDQKVFWYKNHGNRQFAPQLIAIEDEQGYNYGIMFVNTGDIDNDGDPDVFTSGKFASHWYENTGNGMFITHELTDVGGLSTPHHFAIGDMDKDGKNDLVVTEYEGSGISWLKNDGQENFTANVIRSAGGSGSTAPILGDFDHDTHLDVMVISSGTVMLYANGGHATSFTNSTSLATSYARALKPLDMNNDGHLDVLIGTQSGVSWGNNDGTGNFTVSQVGTLQNVNTVDAGDFDNDGDMDVLAGAGGDEGIRWTENIGTASAPQFGAMNLIQRDMTGAGAADLDADGYDDFVSFGENDDWDDFQLAVHYFNSGAITNSDASAYARVVLIGRESADIALGDADGDGDLDVFQVIADREEVNLFENLGNGHFAPRNLDGAWVYGAQGWSDNPSNFWLDNPSAIATGDLVGNGDLDVAFACRGGGYSNRVPGIYYMLGDGTGTFTTSRFDLFYPNKLDSPNFIHAADIDNDGDTDVLVASDEEDTMGNNPPRGRILLLEMASGTYNPRDVATLQSEERLNHFVVGDIDGDNDKDVLWSAVDNDNTNGTGLIAWSKNNGSSFSRQTVASGFTHNGYWPVTVALIDLDEDGDLDVLAGVKESQWGSGMTGQYYINNGSGTFTLHEQANDAVKAFTYHNWVIADMNNDGRDDIVGTSNWYENEIGLELTQHSFQYNSDHSDMPKQAADVDGDGDLDLLTNGTWFENIGDNCPSVSNTDQTDTDDDGVGDACE